MLNRFTILDSWVHNVKVKISNNQAVCTVEFKARAKSDWESCSDSRSEFNFILLPTRHEYKTKEELIVWSDFITNVFFSKFRIRDSFRFSIKFCPWSEFHCRNLRYIALAKFVLDQYICPGFNVIRGQEFQVQVEDLATFRAP